jgi:hypothetical protein
LFFLLLSSFSCLLASFAARSLVPLFLQLLLLLLLLLLLPPLRLLFLLFFFSCFFSSRFFFPMFRARAFFVFALLYSFSCLLSFFRVLNSSRLFCLVSSVGGAVSRAR